jgi:hypothetical protein
MATDYGSTEKVLELTFAKWNASSVLNSFPQQNALALKLEEIFARPGASNAVFAHTSCRLLASASVEMWHRALHSFLYSVALTENSPIWASVAGYYASHFVMRAFAHSFGFFKSFSARKIVQYTLTGNTFVCTVVDERDSGEHKFYWKIVKDHPHFSTNPLFRYNSDRDPKSDCAHRNYANYSDHINSFKAVSPWLAARVEESVEKISRIRKHSVTGPSREGYPDLLNVQILAYQRIVTYREYMDDKLTNNKFWKLHRDPLWCRKPMRYELEDSAPEVLLS